MTEQKVTPRQRKAIESLLTSGDVSQAAQVAGVSRKTIYVWFKRPAFVGALRQAEQQALDGLQRALVSLGDKAVGALADGMSASTPIASRIRAADVALARLLQLRELIDLEARVAELEQRLEGKHERT